MSECQDCRFGYDDGLDGSKVCGYDFDAHEYLSEERKKNAERQMACKSIKGDK